MPPFEASGCHAFCGKSKTLSCGCGEQQQSVETASPSMGKADNNSDPCDRLSAWLPSCELQNGQRA